MIKILYIHHTAGWGGSANSLIKLINNLDTNRFEPSVLLLKNSEIADKLAANSIRFRIADSIFYKKYYKFFPHSEAGYIKWFQIIKFLHLSILWLLSRFYFADKELAKHKFHIVHLNSSVLTDWLGPAKKRGRVVMHIREPFRKGKLDILHPFFRSAMERNADIIIAISKDNAERVSIPLKTKVIYNFSDIPSSSPSEESYRSRKVLYLGGSSTSKGFYTLVKALDHLDKDVVVYFGGKYVISCRPKNLKGLLKYYLSRAKARNRAIKVISKHSNAKMAGVIEDPEEYFNEVCCLVSPFTVPHFSRPVIEAYLHRKPAIGSDVEGMNEIISDHTGMIVRKNKPEELAYAINKLVANSKRAKELGEEAFKIAITRYTPSNNKQIESIYEELYSKCIGS